MKNITRLFFLLFLIPSKSTAQNKNSLQVEILPIAIVNQNGTGLQIAWQRQINDKIYLELGYGIIYDLINQSGYDSPKANGLPIGKYTTEVNIKDAAQSFNFILPDPSVIADLNRMGFKQITPFKSYRLDNYGSFSVGFSVKKLKKWRIIPQLGLLLGIANRTEIGGGLTSNLGDNPFIGSTAPQGWIVFQAYSRYWYFGVSGKVNVYRRIKDNTFLGVVAGTNLILDEKSRVDDLIFYTGVSLKVGF